MIHIKPNRCGYEGYRCVGIGQLNKAFRSKLVADTERDRVSSWTYGPDQDDYISNYLNIPVNVKGSIMAVARVHALSAPVAPEQSCATNLDPFSGGLLDFYSLYPTIIDYNVDDYTGDDPLYSTTLLDFSANDATLCPGALEPALNATFNPVSMLGPAASDLVLDGLVLGIMKLYESRNVMCDYLNRTIRQTQDTMARLLTIQDPTSIITDNDGIQFGISKTSGSSIIGPGGAYPAYHIDGGYAYVNNQSFTVQGLDNITPPFTVWAEVNGTINDGVFTPTGVNFTTQRSANKPSFVIGRVNARVSDIAGTTGKKTNIPTRTYFEIEQDRHDLNEQVWPWRGTGVMYSDRGKLKIIPTASCDGD